MSYKTTKITSTMNLSSLASLSPNNNDYIIGGSSALTTGQNIPKVSQPLMYYWQGTTGGTGSTYYYRTDNGRNTFTWRMIGGLASSFSFLDPDGNVYDDYHYDDTYVTTISRDTSSTPVPVATNNWHRGFTLSEGTYLLKARISTNHVNSNGWIECAWHDSSNNIVGPRQMMADRGANFHLDFVFAIVTVGSGGESYYVKATAVSGNAHVAIHMNSNDMRTSVVTIEKLV